jgi:hypothetical protein
VFSINSDHDEFTSLPSAVTQRIVVKFIVDEIAKPDEILKLRSQFGDGTLSSTQKYDWSNKSFKEGRTEVDKTYEDI